MDKAKVGQLLYGEFGDKEFSAGQISATTLSHLAKEMGITDTKGPALNILVGKRLESLCGIAFRIETGGPAELEVHFSEKVGKAATFEVVPIDVSGAENTTWISDKLVGVEHPDAETIYSVVLVYSGDGYAVYCPALRGCVSQGETEEEALENIKEAITGWLQCEVLDARKRTKELLDEEMEAGFPAKLVNVQIGPITT